MVMHALIKQKCIIFFLDSVVRSVGEWASSSATMEVTVMRPPERIQANSEVMVGVMRPAERIQASSEVMTGVMRP